MNILKAALLEEFVRRVSQVIADAHDSRNQLCAASQVSLSPQVLISVLLWGQWVLCSRSDANEVTLVHLLAADGQLEGLTLLRATDQLARGLEAGADLHG